MEALIDSAFGLPLLCAALAALVVSPIYRSPYLNWLATPAPLSAQVPRRAFARAALIAYIALINAASLTLAHRLPVGSTLVAGGFLLLLFLPKEEPAEGAG